MKWESAPKKTICPQARDQTQYKTDTEMKQKYLNKKIGKEG